MTKPYLTPTDTVLVAIDVAKTRNEVLIEVPGRARRRRLTVLNTRAEHDRFLAELEALDLPIVVGLEATGNYHRPLAWRLLAAGVAVRLVSSVALARTREAAKMARVVHAVVKTGADYRPFVEAAVPSGRTPLRVGREGASATL